MSNTVLTNKIINKRGNGYRELQFLPRTPFYLAFICVLERFAFVGCKCLLTVYMVEHLSFPPQVAIVSYHLFCGCSSLLAAIAGLLTDKSSWKFTIIVCVSIPNIVGYILLTTTSLANYDYSDTRMKLKFGAALSLLALGNGFVHTIYVSFMFEQLGGNQEKLEMDLFLVVYYCSRLVGSVTAMHVAPTLRTEIMCLGTDCFAATYIFNSVIVVLFTILYFLAHSVYASYEDVERERKKSRVETKGMFGFCRGFHAFDGLMRRFWKHFFRGIPKTRQRSEVKSLDVIYLIYVMIFWSLCNQQGSIWVLQGMKLNSFLGRVVDVKPEQMQLLFPLFSVFLPPMYTYIISRLLFKNREGEFQRRIFLGGVCTSMSFLCAWYLEKTIAFVRKGSYLSSEAYESLQSMSFKDINKEISILWQIVQYVWMSLGEVLLFSTVQQIFFQRYLRSARTIIVFLTRIAMTLGDFVVAVVYIFDLKLIHCLLGFAIVQFVAVMIHGFFIVFDFIE